MSNKRTVTGEIRFIHYRADKSSPYGGVSIAYEVLVDENTTRINEKGEVVHSTENDHVVAMAVSRCHPNDHFDRRKGRVKARGRLHSSAYARPVQRTLPNFLDFVYDTARELADLSNGKF
jgi:hypothetical protein